MAQQPATPAKALETIPSGLDPEAYKRCMEYCQAQGVNLDTFKLLGLAWTDFALCQRSQS